MKTIKIAIKENLDGAVSFVDCPVYAERGGLAITKALLRRDKSGNLIFGERYRITHVKSGHAVYGDIKKLKWAREIFDAILAIGFDFTLSEKEVRQFDKAPLTEIHKQVKANGWYARASLAF